MHHTLSTDVKELSGIGKVRAEKLAKLGIVTLRDLIYHFPRAYENRADVIPLGSYDTENARAYVLTVASPVKSVMIKKGMTLSKFRAFDESGSCEVVFFNSTFVKDIFHVGETYRFYGKASFTKNRLLNLTSPKYDPYIEGKELAPFSPVYSLTEGITSKLLEKMILGALNDVLPFVSDPLPEDIRLENDLPTLGYAIKQIHFPKDIPSLRNASRRLAFDEMFYFALGISMTSMKKQRSRGISFNKCTLRELTDRLPYELTGAQKNAINDIYRDTVFKDENGVTSPMARILIGDVGSGKTVCAIAAMYIATRSSYQSAIMVPTEILANQHYADIKALLSPLGIRVELLTGSLTPAKKKNIYERIENGEIDIVVGTHALLSEKLTFKALGLIVTDEQHRFGVAQRAVLKEKAKQAHLLVMSATPIPRTLALALYGDLDISRIDEMPKGRIPVETFVVDESYRDRLNTFIKRQVELGGQCYIVCPSIEPMPDDGLFVFDTEDEQFVGRDSLNLKNVTEHTEKLRASLPGISIASLHGKMKASEKDAVIKDFSSGKTSVLVSTTVVEVGVNVPNAALMIIENAERYGLSQLHQLRGRVGRGARKSYCVLVSDMRSDKVKGRLNVMRESNDGFEIAEKDLLLRGPGEFFSSNADNNLRQSGGFEFKLSGICNDSDLITKAFSAAKKVLLSDPELNMHRHILIKDELSGLIFNSSTIS